MQRDCDLCREHGTITPATVDRATTFGPWAYMCASCDDVFGVGRATVLANIA